MFERIIVAIDGSEAAKRALLVATSLAEKYGSKIHLVHSPQLETTAIAVGSGAVEIKPDETAVAEAGRIVIDEAKEILANAGVSASGAVIGSKDPSADILDAIGDKNADLVVMGRRGLGAVTSLILGSVSQKVSQQAPCACMTVL